MEDFYQKLHKRHRKCVVAWEEFRVRNSPDDSSPLAIVTVLALVRISGWERQCRAAA